MALPERLMRGAAGNLAAGLGDAAGEHRRRRLDAAADQLLTQGEAAELLRVSVSYLRASSCPKILLPGRGDRGKPLVRYLRSDVLAWALARRT
jgi:hypothetical protein